MIRAHQYQEILDKHFQANFDDWKNIPPSDPMKLFVEAIGVSLQQVEASHVTFANTLMDSMPAFFGFERKASAPESHFFSLSLAPSERTYVPLPKGTAFNVANQGKRLMARLLSETFVFPFEEFTQTHEEHFSSFTFTSLAIPPVLQFLVTHTDGSALPPLNPDNISVTRTSKDGVKTVWEAANLHLDQQVSGDGSSIFCAVSPNTGTPIFANGNGTFTIHWLSEDSSGALEVQLNVAHFSVCVQSLRTSLGQLTGAPWEKLALPSLILGIPNEVTVTLPSEEIVLHRVDSDLLKVRVTEPNRFYNGFFYEPSTHSLVFPDTHRLMASFHTGGSVDVKEALSHLSESESLAQARFDFADHRNHFEQAVWLKKAHSLIAMESLSEYLNRFYAAVRLFSTSEAKQVLLPASTIEAEVMGSHSTISRAEVYFEPSDKVVNVFILPHQMEYSNGIFLSADVVNAVNHVLRRRIPIDYRYQIHPFKITRLAIHASLRTCINESRLGVITSQVLQTKVANFISSLLQPQVMKPSVRQSLSSLTEQITSELLQRGQEHACLRANELESITLLVRETEHQRYTNHLVRQAGEILLPAFQFDIAIESGTPSFIERRSHV